jgi:hypothetical protein
MAQRELVFGSHIEDCDQIVAQPRDKVITGYGFECVARLKVVSHDTADLGNIPFADTTQSFDQRDHLGFARQAIKNVFAAALRLDQARAPEDLKVARGVGKRQMRPSGEFLDAAHPLREVLQQLKPMLVTERLRHSSEVLVNRLFRSGA